jgi:hypothetical protein
MRANWVMLASISQTLKGQLWKNLPRYWDAVVKNELPLTSSQRSKPVWFLELLDLAVENCAFMLTSIELHS